MLVANRENLSNTVITHFVLHNLYCINGEEYLEEILYEIMNQERPKHQRTYHKNNDVLQVGGKNKNDFKKLHISNVSVHSNTYFKHN